MCVIIPFFGQPNETHKKCAAERFKSVCIFYRLSLYRFVSVKNDDFGCFVCLLLQFWSFVRVRYGMQYTTWGGGQRGDSNVIAFFAHVCFHLIWLVNKNRLESISHWLCTCFCLFVFWLLIALVKLHFYVTLLVYVYACLCVCVCMLRAVSKLAHYRLRVYFNMYKLNYCPYSSSIDVRPLIDCLIDWVINFYIVLIDFRFVVFFIFVVVGWLFVAGVYRAFSFLLLTVPVVLTLYIRTKSPRFRDYKQQFCNCSACLRFLMHEKCSSDEISSSAVLFSFALFVWFAM